MNLQDWSEWELAGYSKAESDLLEQLYLQVSDIACLSRQSITRAVMINALKGFKKEKP